MDNIPILKNRLYVKPVKEAGVGKAAKAKEKAEGTQNEPKETFIEDSE
jgi:hypothetical protein